MRVWSKMLVPVIVYLIGACSSNKTTEPSESPPADTTTNPPSYNYPPEIISFSANPNFGYSPLDVIFTWSINDPENDPLTCEIDVDNDGNPETTINNCTSSDTYQYTYSGYGIYTAYLKVIDTSGNYTFSSVDIKICKTVDIVDQNISVGANSSYSITFSAFAEDTLHYYAQVIDGNDISQLLVIYVPYDETLYINSAFTSASDEIYLPYDGNYKIILKNTALFSSKIYYIYAMLKRCPSWWAKGNLK